MSDPVIDVPHGDTDAKIKDFISTYSKPIEDYAKVTFEFTDKKSLVVVIRECAECVINQRTPRKDKAWSDDVTIIEEIIEKVCSSNEINKPELKQGGIEMPKVKKAVKKVASKKQVKPTGQKKEKKIKPVKKDVKKVIKKPLKKEVKKIEPKLPKASLTSSKKPMEVRGLDLDIEKVKKANGVDKYAAALYVLKRQRRAWVQQQDIKVLAKCLFNVQIGKSIMPERIKGLGEKDYAKRRLTSMLAGILDVISKVGKH